MKAVDLAEGERFLTRTYGAESLVRLVPAEVRREGRPSTRSLTRSGDDLNEFLYRKVREAYRAEGRRVPGARGDAELHGGQAAAARRSSATTATACTAGRAAPRHRAWPHASTARKCSRTTSGFFAVAFKALEDEGWTEEFDPHRAAQPSSARS